MQKITAKMNDIDAEIESLKSSAEKAPEAKVKIAEYEKLKTKEIELNAEKTK